MSYNNKHYSWSAQNTSRKEQGRLLGTRRVFTCGSSGWRQDRSNHSMATINYYHGFEGFSRSHWLLSQGFLNYGLIELQVTKMFRNNVFQWTAYALRAFDTLKQALSSTPVLSLLDLSQTFVINCDASNVGIGAVLQQQSKPIAFIDIPWLNGIRNYQRTKKNSMVWQKLFVISKHTFGVSHLWIGPIITAWNIYWNNAHRSQPNNNGS